jgi:transposase-like protein
MNAGLEILLTPMRDQITVVETCRRYGITRQTFYVYQRRFYADGVGALEPLSRRPRTSPAQTDLELEAEIVRLRKANPRWGARTIQAHLQRSGAPVVPAVSTIHLVLQCNSLIIPRTARRECQRGGASNATRPTTCGRSTAPRSISRMAHRRG